MSVTVFYFTQVGLTWACPFRVSLPPHSVPSTTTGLQQTTTSFCPHKVTCDVAPPAQIPADRLPFWFIGVFLRPVVSDSQLVNCSVHFSQRIPVECLTGAFINILLGNLLIKGK